MLTGYARYVETERLLLRPFTARDLSEWHRVIFSDPEVMRYLPARAPVPRERTAGLLRSFVSHWDDHGFGPWAVILAAEGRLIGHCGLRYLPESIQVELLYALQREAWGHGYATEAARAALRYGFEEAGLGKIVALAMPENEPSRNVMRKLGMVEEGPTQLFGLDLVRYSMTHEGFRRGRYEYSLLREIPREAGTVGRSPGSD